jgi:hypothetical protein
MSRGPIGDFGYVFVLVVAVIAFLNIRAVRFCDTCGKMVRQLGIFSRAEFCSKCGAKLK